MALQDSSDRTSSNRAAARIMLAVFAVMAVLIVTGANWYLQNSRERMLREVGQNLNVQVNNKVALLTVWSGAIIKQVEMFAEMDLLRLFAAEVNSSRLSADVLLHESQKEPESLTTTDGFVDPVMEGLRAPSQDPISSILPRLPMMLRQLKDFVEKNSFWGACLINTDLEVYLSPGEPPVLSVEQRAYITEAIRTRHLVFLPVRRQNGELVMDMAFPIVAPLYVDAAGDRVVSVLLATTNVLPVVKAITRHTGGREFSSAILEHFGQRLQRIDPTVREGFVDLPGWKLEAGHLPLAMRTEPGPGGNGEDTTYTLGVPVPRLPWLVDQGVEAVRIDASYNSLRKNVILGAALVLALTGIMLSALWWWLVGRRERAVADQLRRLYLMVNQQKQIMDGVNSALSAGVVLNDLNGTIFYANQSFAHMVGMEANSMRGRPYTDLGPDIARSLVTHTLAVHQTGDLSSFTESLPVDGKLRYFFTSCTPFRDEAGRMSGVVSVYSDVTDLATAQQKAQQMVNQTVNAYVRAVEAVDSYLCGHSSLMAQLAVTLAYVLDKTDAVTLATLRTAANLSQIGMIQLPRDLLTKSGALTPEERTQLQKHVEYARSALQGIDFGLPVLEAISQMYEREDGSGYPAGISGDAICENARILAVANTFCALVRSRSYRQALSVEQALEILSEQPPKYDMRVVAALKKFLTSEQGAAFLAQLENSRHDNPEHEG
ncbi:MAG: hypothetical protein DESF_01014 [Desulfovibrio sp.]